MINTLLERQNDTENAKDDDGLDHGYCDICYPDPDLLCIALCGLDVTDAPYVIDDRGRDCPICDIADYCGMCGERFDDYD